MSKEKELEHDIEIIWYDHGERGYVAKCSCGWKQKFRELPEDVGTTKLEQRLEAEMKAHAGVVDSAGGWAEAHGGVNETL